MAAVRVGFLALIWVFIALAAGVIRTDIFGERLETDKPSPQRRGLRRRREDKKSQAVELPPVATRLVLTEGRGQGAVYPLDGVMGLGRAHNSTVRIDDDFSSSRHAVLRPEHDGRWLVEDLNSTNGTYVNAVKITQPTRVGPGDLIRIGRTQLRLEP